jgi:hypothetical protein
VSRNIARVAIVVWLAISVYTGLTSWTHHDVPVVREVPVTEANLSGLETIGADYECPAVIGGEGGAQLVDEIDGFLRASEVPCERFVRGRQLLFWIDVLVGVGALALTFAHLPRRFRERDHSVERTIGRPAPV